ncbi:MAG: TonB-dependent receptor plug domain-containing protein [Methylococcaceae bacterium]
MPLYASIKNPFLAVAIFISSCPVSQVSFAQKSPTELESMTISSVTSTAPSLNNDEAMSKTELYDKELSERGINNLSDISQRVANFHSSSEGIGSAGQIFSLRGLVNTQFFGEPAVVFYVDDVPYSSSSATMGRLFSIDSIAVYRSSQPALFGKNAYAGGVDIKTLQPKNKLTANTALEIANFNSHQITANSSGALIADTLYFSLGGHYQQRDGFLYNSYLNTHPDAIENFSGRASLKWTPNKQWDIRLNYIKEDFNYGANRFVRLDSPDFFTVRSEAAEKLKQQTDMQSLRMRYNGDNYQLLSVSSRRFWTMQRVSDLDLLPSQFTRIQNLPEETWTQEFRLNPKNKNQLWQWQLGLFYSNNNKMWTTDTLQAGIDTNFTLKSRIVEDYTVFAKVNYQGLAKIKPYFDLRIDYINNSINATTSISTDSSIIGLQQQSNDFFVSPQFGIDYEVSAHLLLYTATGLSYKPAGFTQANLNKALMHYAKERFWHNELGIKTNWFDERFKLNLAGFYYSIDNYQVERFFTNVDYAIINAAKAHSYGFEVESQAELIKNLWLDTAMGYSHTQFERYTNPITGINYSGKYAPFVPEFTATTALQYKNSAGYFARVEWLWTGRTFFDETNSALMTQNAYSTANIRIGYSKNNYGIYGFINNISDTHYCSFKLSNTRCAPANPQMLGVKLELSF